jgi:hypothetical protein
VWKVRRGSKRGGGPGRWAGGSRGARGRRGGEATARGGRCCTAVLGRGRLAGRLRRAAAPRRGRWGRPRRVRRLPRRAARRRRAGGATRCASGKPARPTLARSPDAAGAPRRGHAKPARASDAPSSHRRLAAARSGPHGQPAGPTRQHGLFRAPLSSPKAPNAPLLGVPPPLPPLPLPPNMPRPVRFTRAGSLRPPDGPSMFSAGAGRRRAASRARAGSAGARLAQARPRKHSALRSAHKAEVGPPAPACDALRTLWRRVRRSARLRWARCWAPRRRSRAFGCTRLTASPWLAGFWLPEAAATRVCWTRRTRWRSATSWTRRRVPLGCRSTLRASNAPAGVAVASRASRRPRARPGAANPPPSSACRAVKRARALAHSTVASRRRSSTVGANASMPRRHLPCAPQRRAGAPSGGSS